MSERPNPLPTQKPSFEPRLGLGGGFRRRRRREELLRIRRFQGLDSPRGLCVELPHLKEKKRRKIRAVLLCPRLSIY